MTNLSLLAASAAFVGLVHSLAPGHWLPVVLMTKTQRWPRRTAALGAFTAAAGHIVVSCGLGLLAIPLHLHERLSASEEQIERYAGLGLAAFGVAFAIFAWIRHSRCHGHEHHGPEPKGKRGAFLFLFSLGLSPCVAVLPVFAAASLQGTGAIVIAMAAFSAGVTAALVGATLLVTLGLVKLDHPILEHYADVITGAGVAGIGLFLYFFAH